MSDFDDRRRERIVPPPVGLEETSQRLESTLWINRQLRLLDREKSSLKIDSLKAELTAMLNDPTFKSYESLLAYSSEFSAIKLNYDQQVDRLQSELDKRPIREIVKYISRDEENSMADAKHGSPVVKSPRNLTRCLVSIIILVLIIVAIHHYL